MSTLSFKISSPGLLPGPLTPLSAVASDCCFDKKCCELKRNKRTFHPFLFCPLRCWMFFSRRGMLHIRQVSDTRNGGFQMVSRQFCRFLQVVLWCSLVVAQNVQIFWCILVVVRVDFFILKLNRMNRTFRVVLLMLFCGLKANVLHYLVVNHSNNTISKISISTNIYYNLYNLV